MHEKFPRGQRVKLLAHREGPGLNFGLSLQLHPYFVSKQQSSGENGLGQSETFIAQQHDK